MIRRVLGLSVIGFVCSTVPAFAVNPGSKLMFGITFGADVSTTVLTGTMGNGATVELGDKPFLFGGFVIVPINPLVAVHSGFELARRDYLVTYNTSNNFYRELGVGEIPMTVRFSFPASSARTKGPYVEVGSGVAITMFHNEVRRVVNGVKVPKNLEWTDGTASTDTRFIAAVGYSIRVFEVEVRYDKGLTDLNKSGAIGNGSIKNHSIIVAFRAGMNVKK